MLKHSLQLRLGQQLAMTPQLQQAIRLLQMPALELQAHIGELLASNVMLETVEDGESTQVLETPEAQIAAPESLAPKTEITVETVDDSWSAGSASSSDSPWSSADDEDRQQEFPETVAESLQDHLIEQLELARLETRQLAIAQALVDAINEDGYMLESLEEIVSALHPEVTCDIHEVERVLRLVQMLDPPGVAARSLSECIELQLRQLEIQTPGLELAIQLAREHLPAVAQRDFNALRKTLLVSEEDLAAAVALVKACHPRPGSVVNATAAEYVTPDVFVRRTEQGWAVEVNGATLPKVRLNQGYASLLGRNSHHATLKAQLQEARWLLKSLEIRHETLLKVTRSIVERQVPFLEHGEEHMRPMILKDIAGAIEMHESTVSRITSGKYMHTPRGVFELRYFFSSQVEGSDGSGTSSTAIRAKIRKLIKEENTDTPLSDGRIAALLSDEGIPVARRTVAKYREAMQIPSSNARRSLCN
jgi:RNA polymerase sigma-54 factor